ncbi:glycosyl transferase family 1 [Flavobacterium faecale]|uniref:Glycosyl transferase family 1 n=1 Tax=Flavobacterium faecale TaxID=1355330 RepID=A0A2S1LCY2_9FLAO|nr:glycosyltransferase family 4 protein [Flavobacterium faecale]AWG21568.1 glycosyl transferase family 1 [Flavobacterium faecale]
MKKRKILFLGETYRADAITWRKGLEEFGDFELMTWELKTPSNSFFNRIARLLEFTTALYRVNKIIRKEKPDLVIAERTTSYGFLATVSQAPMAVIAQQGITDLWPIHSFTYPLKKVLQQYAFKNAVLIHAWGSVMLPAMITAKVDLSKVMVLPKGIDVAAFYSKSTVSFSKIKAIVTRSLTNEYRHETIIKAFGLLHDQGHDFELTFVGDGYALEDLKQLTIDLKIDQKVRFLGRMPYNALPALLQQANFYLSMPNTEGVSASLFEAMASGCYPIVSDIEGNREWISPQINGALVPVDDYQALANTLITTYNDHLHRINAIAINQQKVKAVGNYATNMTLIAQKYHELIDKAQKL